MIQIPAMPQKRNLSVHNRHVNLLLLIALTCASITILPSSVKAQDSQDVQASVIGIAINKPDPNSEYGQSLVFGRAAGVEVHLQVGTESMHIIALEAEGPGVGIEVPEGKKLEASRFSDISFGAQIDENGKSVRFSISSPEMPPTGTTKLLVKGSVVLLVGENPANAEQAFELKAGAKGKLGAIDVEIEEVGEDSFGEEGLTVSFKSTESLDTLKALRFFDEKGTEIESSPAGRYSFGFGNSKNHNTSYRLAGKHSKIQAKVEYFRETKKVNVPIEQEVTFGF
ncbi:MAG TPA: hypothetical protein PKD64_08770 [Pirellulaceae bacterium]|nr:hypothetical protein [Pirellulaceae bacterium]HMO92279.1 hypothetical protein [Pirellulaceae bacterium]HMP70097.1 hypothetical protein [Pirellulaceae bacterium]